MGDLVIDACRAVQAEAASDVDGSTDALLGVLARALRCRAGFVTLASHEATRPGLRGWQAVTHASWGDVDEARRRRVTQALVRSVDDLSEDPVLRARLVQRGRPRVDIHRRLVTPEAWRRSAVAAMMDALRVGDRMVAALPYGPNAEVHFGFDRFVGEAAFDADDLDALRACEPALQEAARRLALGYGLGRGLLTPRQREVLRCLLEGRGEKEVAAHLGIARRSAHHHVTAIYRRLGVSSRAELMAQWLEPVPAAEPRTE